MKNGTWWMAPVSVPVIVWAIIGFVGSQSVGDVTRVSAQESTVATEISPVTVAREPLVLPTYEIGPADRNPIFYTGRVYQGARGEIYPYPLYDQLTDQRVDRTYESLVLENEFCRVCVLPQIGGRILSATDKSNGYEFFYRQHVVKPALIGMLGAWMSGGVEWNIPHHHRPSSFMAIDRKISMNEDGSGSILVGETELRHRMKWTVRMTMFPERSYLEAKVRIMNRSPWTQSILSWANVSVHCNENYQVIFPPSTRYGTGHSKTEFVHWPVDKGVDLSWWKNHTHTSRSVFAWNFTDDFLAGYDHGKHAGTVHVGNHHEIGGKKFFLWGNHENAQMWDQILTDEDGPYLELMVGAYSDNQPDYSWIAPGEVREFRHYWYPVSGIGGVKAANIEGALNVERTEPGTVAIGFCPTRKLNGAEIRYTIVGTDGKPSDSVSVPFDAIPGRAFTTDIPVPETIEDQNVRVRILDAKGVELIAYTPVSSQIVEPGPEPEPVRPTPVPEKCETNEDLYLAGLRLEQFHNAQRNPLDYYQEALRRDP
ncbi:MAG: DUF5107 domain-containing protein, partial [Planctomycetia bacterium]|nr:DUF5107 domain-containing protein [Planctomycetia bacterium]